MFCLVSSAGKLPFGLLSSRVLLVGFWDLPAARAAVKFGLDTETTYARRFAKFVGGLADFGDVAQLVRVPDCRSGGCGFESRRPRSINRPQTLEIAGFAA